MHRRSLNALKSLLALSCCALLLGCNLVRGVGQDMSAVGRTLTKVSGTESTSQHTAADPAAQPFDQPDEDQSYVEPTPLPQ